MIKHKNVIILILLIIILAVLDYFFLNPEYEKYTALQSAIKEKKIVLEQKQGYFSKLTNISVKMEKYQEQLDKIDSAIPDELSEAAILNFLQEKSFEAGLTVNNVSISAPSVSKGQTAVIKKISFSLGLTGSYLSFKKFLSDIYQSSRIIDVDLISFTAPAPKTNFFDFNVNLSAYYYQKLEANATTSVYDNPPEKDKPL